MTCSHCSLHAYPHVYSIYPQLYYAYPHFIHIFRVLIHVLVDKYLSTFYPHFFDFYVDNRNNFFDYQSFILFITLVHIL